MENSLELHVGWVALQMSKGCQGEHQEKAWVALRETKALWSVRLPESLTGGYRKLVSPAGVRRAQQRGGLLHSGFFEVQKERIHHIMG